MARATATLVLASLLLAAESHAQPVDGPKPPAESVTVTGQKQGAEEIIRGFVKSYAAPAPALGRMAKWARGMCPTTAGLPDAFNRLVTKRVREIATMAGAPLLPEQSCKPNIDIVFTRQPQLLLNQIRKEHPTLLGYHYTAQAETVAAVRYPIQAWYTTETEDLNGLRQIDDPQQNRGVDIIIPPGADLSCIKGCTMHFPDARKMSISGGRITNSLRSQFFHVIVVIDLDKISGLEIGPLADDIAVLALTQPQAFDACLTPPSITNLMSPGCAQKPKAITEMDLAYLRAVYKLDTAKVFSSQKSEIAYQMEKALAGN